MTNDLEKPSPDKKKKPMHPLAAVGIAIFVIIGTMGVAALGIIGLIAFTCSK